MLRRTSPSSDAPAADTTDASVIVTLVHGTFARGTAWMSDWSGSDIPAMRLISESLLYATELERIV